MTPEGIEVFYLSKKDIKEAGPESRFYTEEGKPLEPGWYWWPCQPGCIPDSDPIGPFESEESALRDACIDDDD